MLWSFPFYYFLIPFTVKFFFDRLPPLSRGEIVKTGSDTSAYAKRVDLSHRRHVLLCTCGFSTRKENIASVTRSFQFLHPDVCTLFCPEGELFRVPELKGPVSAYLEKARQAGREYAAGDIQEETRRSLEELILPEDVFVQMANASWAEAPGATQ